MAMGEAAAVAMGEATSTEAQQRRQRKWEAGAEGQVVAEVVVFSSENEEEEMEERTGRRGDVRGDRGRGGSRGAVAVAAWLGQGSRKRCREEQQKDVWVELRWNTKKGKRMVHEKRETQKHPRSPMTTNGEYTLFRLAVFFFFLSVFFFCCFFAYFPSPFVLCMFCVFCLVLSSYEA